MTPRIPSFIRLPGPRGKTYVIRVQQVKPKTLAPAEMACWYAQTCGGVLHIPRSAPRKRKLLLFDHEMAHALHDYRLWLLQELGVKELE